MRISGFTFVKNAVKLYYPIKESILSALPLVDELVVALGNCDEDDRTAEAIASINSNKIKIIRTVWDIAKYPRGMEHAHQTDIAKQDCSGDWLLYLQADELIHENDYDKIFARCEQLKDDKEIEGLLFNYYHFWGDYEHYHRSHSWYAQEIRMIKNDSEIHSWESAQSFRRIPDFDGIFYRQQEGTYKLKVAEVDAHIYHYGWVRPPELMQRKRKAFDTIHKGATRADKIYETQAQIFDYGYMGNIPKFDKTHPVAMKEMIDKFYWKDKLNFNDKSDITDFKHEKLRNKLISFIENKIFREQIFGFRNWIKLRR